MRTYLYVCVWMVWNTHIHIQSLYIYINSNSYNKPIYLNLFAWQIAWLAYLNFRNWISSYYRLLISLATDYLISASVNVYGHITTIKRFRTKSIGVHVIVDSKIHFTSSHFTSRLYYRLIAFWTIRHFKSIDTLNSNCDSILNSFNFLQYFIDTMFGKVTV